MGEGYRGREPIESRRSAPSADFERAEQESPVERLIRERWRALNTELEGFREAEVADTLDSLGFISESVTEWEGIHKESERVDTASSFERANFLLGQLVEKGAEWSAHKKAVTRRFLYGFANQSLGAMNLEQQGIMNRTLLADKEKLASVIGSPMPREQELIDEWMKDTVKGVR